MVVPDPMDDFEENLVKALRDFVETSRWQNVGSSDELKRKTCNRISSDDGEDIVLVYHPPDGFYAMGASCPHEGGPLELGDIEEIGGHSCLVCPWHDYDFRLDNGESTTGLSQQVYDVKIVDGYVYINSRAKLLLPQILTEDKAVNQESVPEVTSVVTSASKTDGDSLCDWAIRILCESDPREKVRLTNEAQQRWLAGDLIDIGTCDPPAEPHRDQKLSVLQPGKMKRGRGGTLASRIAVLHSLANIEQWAIDLSWDIIARFSGMALGDDSSLPREFFTDFIKVAADEAKHYTILEERLQKLGSHFGALPVHNGLWQSATETKDDFLARLAVVHMVHEARGLDVHPKTLERFARQKDTESVDILEVIYADEITHVAAGMKWFTYVCRHTRPPLECIPKFHELVRAHFRGFLKPPFNEKGRETAGMTKEWYLPLVKPKDGAATT